jgi:hypothetical protein
MSLPSNPGPRLLNLTRHQISFLRYLVIVLVPVAYLAGQSIEDYPHPELNWKTIETQHFLVHFHDGTERTAQEVAKIARTRPED